MLKLIALNGKIQGSEFDLVEGMTIGSHGECDIVTGDSGINNDLVQASCDASGNFYLASKSKVAIIDLGGELLSKLEVLPGLIFSIGEIGFSIQESDRVKEDSNFSALETFTVNEENRSAVYPLKTPIKFEFVRGALLNTSMEIHWHPYAIGAKSNFDHFVDQNINLEDDILALESSTETDNPQTLIRPFISNFISINSQLISKPTIVKNGDLVEFSDTAFYIRIK